MTKKRKSSVENVGAAFSQFLHSLTDGDSDISMSAASHHRNLKIKRYIDWTFRYIDGEDHCERSYDRDLGENYERLGNVYAITIFAFTFCTVINFLHLPRVIWISISRSIK